MTSFLSLKLRIPLAEFRLQLIVEDFDSDLEQ